MADEKNLAIGLTEKGVRKPCFAERIGFAQ